MWLRWSAVLAVPTLRSVKLDLKSGAGRTAGGHHVGDGVEAPGSAGRDGRAVRIVLRTAVAHRPIIASTLAGRPAGHRLHVVAEDEAEAVGKVGANADGHRADAAGPAGREALVIDHHIVRQDRISDAIEHGGSPIGRAVDRPRLALVVARRTASGTKAIVGRVGVGASVADEHVQVRRARLARIDDRIVFQELAGTRSTVKPECTQITCAGDRGNAGTAIRSVGGRLERRRIIEIVRDRVRAGQCIGRDPRAGHRDGLRGGSGFGWFGTLRLVGAIDAARARQRSCNQSKKQTNLPHSHCPPAEARSTTRRVKKRLCVATRQARFPSPSPPPGERRAGLCNPKSCSFDRIGSLTCAGTTVQLQTGRCVGAEKRRRVWFGGLIGKRDRERSSFSGSRAHRR